MRADKFFSERFGSRTKSAEALRAGLVLRGNKPLSPNDEVSPNDDFDFLAPCEHYVSNGGYKLARGLDVFGESVKGCVFADLGASTGGFTDCLLQRGVRKVFCVDVGKSQLAAGIAADARVTVMDGTNARYLSADDFPCPLDGAVADLSFISLKLILPALVRILPEDGRAFVLFKPQFECGGSGIGKSGIVPQRRHIALLDGFYDFCTGLGLSPRGVVNAPVRAHKNIEYMIFLRHSGETIGKSEFLHAAGELFEAT